MYWRKAIFHLIISIIFKSNENLDNNFTKNHSKMHDLMGLIVQGCIMKII